jgi:N-carbamoylputrescine amidase
VAGTSGQILAKASVDREEVMLVPIELDKVDVTRTHWPFLRDRRIDAYGDLTKRFSD